MCILLNLTTDFLTNSLIFILVISQLLVDVFEKLFDFEFDDFTMILILFEYRKT